MAAKKVDVGTRESAKAGTLTITFDSAQVPTRNSSMRHKLAFAAAYLNRFLEGESCNVSTIRQCVKWVEEASRKA